MKGISYKYSVIPPLHVGHGTQERILTAWCEELETDGRSLSEWLDIKYIAAALTDEDLRLTASEDVRTLEQLMQSWKGNASNPYPE